MITCFKQTDVLEHCMKTNCAQLCVAKVNFGGEMCLMDTAAFFLNQYIQQQLFCPYASMGV